MIDAFVSGIDPTVANGLRGGAVRVLVVDESPGYPCRQCLLDAAVGEEVVLVSYDPFSTTSPYRSASPIFLHREPCTPFTPSSELPDQLTRRVLSVRALDHDEQQLDAVVIEGRDLANTIERMFAAPAVARIHVHNAAPGCFAARIDRGSAAP